MLNWAPNNRLRAALASAFKFLETRYVGESGMNSVKKSAMIGRTGAHMAMIFHLINIPIIMHNRDPEYLKPI